jgi:hypothetical protein
MQIRRIGRDTERQALAIPAKEARITRSLGLTTSICLILLFGDVKRLA